MKHGSHIWKVGTTLILILHGPDASACVNDSMTPLTMEQMLPKPPTWIFSTEFWVMAGVLATAIVSRLVVLRRRFNRMRAEQRKLWEFIGHPIKQTQAEGGSRELD